MLLQTISRRRNSLLLVATAAVVVILLTGHFFLRAPYSGSQRLIAPDDQRQKRHPITTLIQRGETYWHHLLSKRTHEVQDAARQYRWRRKRHPPPGFDEWFQYAQERDAVIVEDFFDQIYHDLNPFWSVEPKKIRLLAAGYEHVVSVRDGRAILRTEHEGTRNNLWHNLVDTIAERLPDLDMPLNIMDESRVVVPWEQIDEAMKIESAARNEPIPAEVITAVPRYPIDEGTEDPVPQPHWITSGSYWDIARVGCPPTSPSRDVPQLQDFRDPPEIPVYPENSFEGYVSNWTLVQDPCVQPHLRALHGAFIEPVSVSTTHELFPIFGGSKLPMNNEILIPPAMYWANDSFFSGGEDEHGPPWERKQDKLMWRGVASGGRNKIDNWKHFHRHRFITMMNGTLVLHDERSGEGAPNFKLPSHQYSLMASRSGSLGEWLSSFTDVGFVHLECFPDEGEEGRTCSYINDYLSWKAPIPMKDQYIAKYLPDIDGNSYSGRYRGFLRSTSLPIKATIYEEWHDSRLVPWVHFVPMDSTYIDIYGILDYFLGFEGYGSHDDAAKKIALSGQDWAGKVLRKEDMQIYVYRLLLEYGRICSEQREKLGYVGDLGA